MTAMPQAPIFWDRIAERYAAQPVRDTGAYARTLDRVRAGLSRNDRVLELGCGTGSTALALADAAGHITATDFAPEMIRIARQKAAAAGTQNVEFQTVDADTPLPGPWDAVLAFNLLHLMDDPARTIRQAHAALAPGGLFITKTVCLGGWRAALFGPVIGVLRLFGRAPSVRLLTINGLERMIERAGFEVVETGTFPASPPARFVVARKI